MRKFLTLYIFIAFGFVAGKDKASDSETWIRVNLLGYQLSGKKVAVLCSKENLAIRDFRLVDIITGQTIFKGIAGKNFGAYGPFASSYRLDFTGLDREGRFVIVASGVSSPEFTVAENVYNGAADFCLRYMRQQRSGFNPFLKDSCHTHDGYTLYAPVADSTHIDVTGGWHDASDYLQYSTTTANATWHLLAAARDYPAVFADIKSANGLDGKNGIPDVLDEAKWGLDWLSKMHPKEDWLFNQLGDDRDHMKMRIPKEDTNYYGRGFERPVYFCTGKPQVRGKFMNATTGVASTAGKFASTFALAAEIFQEKNASFSRQMREKSKTALALGIAKPGFCQTASVRSPYIYAEENWNDDMELAFASLGRQAANKSMLDSAFAHANLEPVTKWLGADTANHYQWYPFINPGHFELAKSVGGKKKDALIGFYRQGIQQVNEKAVRNAFYRGIPFIWCSNNLTTSFAIQCAWYRQLTGDDKFEELEQANFDWLFGVNPWGTSMVYGLPSIGDTPSDPHSAFTHLKKYPIDGGLVDGPVYTSIYRSLIGIQLMEPDEYEKFQSNLAVYHDDYGDYSTNEPTMDGTASLIYLLASKQGEKKVKKKR